MPELSQLETGLEVPVHANIKSKTKQAPAATAATSTKKEEPKVPAEKKITNDDSCDCSKEVEAAAKKETDKCAATKDRKDAINK